MASARRPCLGELLEKHLLSGLLLTPPARREQWRLPVDDIFRRWFPDTDPTSLLTVPWIHVPILAVQGGNSRVVAMMIGLPPEGDSCHALDRTAAGPGIAEAVAVAHRLAGRPGGVVYWFLQQKDETPLQGGSLALPVAIALVLFQRSISWPRGLYATGELNGDGTIAAVDHVREKYDAVACSCGLFLAPFPAPADTAPVSPRDRPILTCATFDDACFAATLFSGGTTEADIALYQACWISERNFFAHFHEIPMPMLSSERAKDYYRLVQAEPEKYLERLAEIFQRCSHLRVRGQILVDLLSPETVMNIAGKSSANAFSAFHWCLAAIAFFNHCGLVREGRRWSSCIEHLCAVVDLEELNRFINHDFVSHRFNRYDFRPQPTRMLAKALAREENKQKIYPGCNALLGALYGTLAQNYGFCGPGYFHSLLDMTARARLAFGGKYHGESQRLLNYEIYGYLDCGNTEKAMGLVNPYLGLAESDGPEQWLRRADVLLESTGSSAPFMVALVMRLLSEIGYIPSPADIRKSASKICHHHGHPWQLVALNLGRLAVTAGLNTEADHLFRHSLHICLDDSETMRPMGLLALAGLQAAGRVGRKEYASAEGIRRWLRRTDSLNREHFQSILEMENGGELLHAMQRNRSRLFPFSYR